MSKITKTTKENIKRLNNIIENSINVCKCCNIPMPSWIELSIIDYCNRKCIFCPKSDDSIAPNQKHLYMSLNLAKKLLKDIETIKYNGTIVLCGYGEPMASPIVMDIIKELSIYCRVEIVTNGDYLTKEKIIELYNAGISYINISVYEGQKRFEDIEKMFSNLNVEKIKYILRDRWYGQEKDYGLKLTNRAGTTNVGNQPKINTNTQCYYPFYSMTIDWNGDVLLCPQDWQRRIKLGNINNNSLHDIWIGEGYKKHRTLLFNGTRTILPCSLCNCDGKLHGKNHSKLFFKGKNV